jgi:histidine decarboxylase
LGHETWPQTVPSDVNGHGTVDVEKLLKLVEFFAKKGHPPLIVLNYGTTFKVQK